MDWRFLGEAGDRISWDGIYQSEDVALPKRKDYRISLFF